LEAGLLNRLRTALTPLIDRVGSTLAKTGVSPTGWSLIGLFFALTSGLMYSRMFDGGWLLAGLLLLASGFFDMVDGAVARVTGTVSERGAFLDSNFDRVAEVLVYGGMTVGGVGEPVVVLAALALSLLVSYSRARGESLGVKVSGVGLGERAERVLILAAASIAGYPYYGVIAVAILAGVTFVQRILYILRGLVA